MASSPLLATILRAIERSVEELTAWSVEAVTVRALERTCPVITMGVPIPMGIPNDLMPPADAPRIYCCSTEETDWQQLVRGLLANSSLIVLRPAKSDGVQWELRQVLANYRDRCALLLADAQGRSFDQNAYQEFRELVAKTCAAVLPETTRNCWFVYFDSRGIARTVEADQTKRPQVGLSQATRILLTRHPAASWLEAPRRQPSVRRVSFLFWAYLWPLALLVLILVVAIYMVLSWNVVQPVVH